MTCILLLPGSKVPYSVDICKFESYHHNVYHDHSIHQCLQRINRENWICMRKHQLSAGQNLSSIQSPLTTSPIKHTLPTLLYVFCFYEFPEFKLYSASFPDFYIVLFGFPSPPQKKKKIIHTKPEYCSQPKPLCFRHPYNRVLHQSPGKFFPSWKLGPMFWSDMNRK